MSAILRKLQCIESVLKRRRTQYIEAWVNSRFRLSGKGVGCSINFNVWLMHEYSNAGLLYTIFCDIQPGYNGIHRDRYSMS